MGTGLSASRVRRLTALVAVVLVAAPGASLAFDDRHAAIPSSGGVIWESAVRAAAAEPLQAPPAKTADASRSAPHDGASMAEKIAFLYLLIGGSVLLIYGPQEKSGDHISVDGIAEGVAGAASIAISFALLHDIRHKRAPDPRP
jgi:hypothetical protein